jgi:hypothetical protein
VKKSDQETKFASYHKHISSFKIITDAYFSNVPNQLWGLFTLVSKKCRSKIARSEADQALHPVPILRMARAISLFVHTSSQSCIIKHNKSTLVFKFIHVKFLQNVIIKPGHVDVSFSIYLCWPRRSSSG